MASPQAIPILEPTACTIAALLITRFFPPKCSEESFNRHHISCVVLNILTTPHLLCCSHRLTRFHLSSQKCKFDRSSNSSNERLFFRVNFLTNAAFAHLGVRRLLEGGIYFTFPFPNASCIGGRRLKEEIQYHEFCVYTTNWSRIAF